jgi:hypothetical protein
MVQVFPGTVSVREQTNGVVSVNLVPLGVCPGIHLKFR